MKKALFVFLLIIGVAMMFHSVNALNMASAGGSPFSTNPLTAKAVLRLAGGVAASLVGLLGSTHGSI